ncbi:hypothetical protein [Vibrio alginolyticus]|uniref:hypothetical protein n=1 Tax=Vibrio alginolyticus TaxID=663 RepID=UPI0006CA6E74|nr:hypothetical protein [Vibrio alginolyticus]CAH7145663.1 putative enzyme [Vibrio chagasii]CAH7316639.1 putative enzyme [Vibrio chagasii]
MAKLTFRGLSGERSKARADTRTPFEKLKSGLPPKLVASTPLLATGASFIPFIQPHAELLIACTLPFAGAAMMTTHDAPFERPYHLNSRDKGFFFFGNEIGTDKEIWFSDSEARRHILCLGTTGAGKTESLVGLIANSLAQNSAFTYCDGKADTGLFAKVFSLCRRFGREDDLLVINYMVGTLRADLKREKKLSNTLNTFTDSTADAITELICSLLPSGGSSDGIWADRAASYMAALIKPLVYLRDEGKILLDVSVIRSYFQLEKTIELSQRTDIPPLYLEGLKAYVLNLPGYQEGKTTQESTVYEQAGYVTMQFQPCFGMLADTYGHIMKTQLSDCNMWDIVVNRRCLLVLLPALEKSPSNLANLGKIIISSIKGMMAGALGAELEGHTEYILDSKPTNGRTYQCCFDEVGYYLVEGTAVMPAQARGIGFSLTFAGQDYQAFCRQSDTEAASVKANCAIKMGMCLEDATDTAAIFVDGAGEEYDEVETGFERESGLFGSHYVKSKQVSYEKKKVVDVLDLKGQAPGEFHILNMDRVIRGRSFYANPRKLPELRVNPFIRVRPPSSDEIEMIATSIKEMKIRFKALSKNPKRFKSAYSKHVDSEIKEFTKNVGYLSEEDPLMQATFALAVRKNAIDIINNQMILKLKEMEQVVNQEVSDEDLFVNEDIYETSSKEEDKHINLTSESESKKLKRLILKNEKSISGKVDLERSPLGYSDYEIDEMGDVVEDISQALISKWKSEGMITDELFLTSPKSQADLAYAAAQNIILNTDIEEKNLTASLDDIELEFTDDI